MTDKQKKFIDEYLVDLNATQAAIRAGYSPKTANEQGAQNLVKLSIPIAQAMAEQSKRTGINADRVLRELARMGFADSEQITEWNMKGADRVKALELLGKHLGLFQDNLAVTVEKSEKLEAVFAQLAGEGLTEDD